MAQQWAVILPGERLESERLFHHDTLQLAGVLPDSGPADSYPDPGDQVLILTDGPAPQVVAAGRVDGVKDGAEVAAAELHVSYTRRAFDEPQPVDGLALEGSLTRLDAATFRALADRLGPAPDRRTWLVSLDLPIEAATQAEAVRTFWSYVMELGPRELPAFVSPSGDELAMQAFVLGEEANLDPEEDDD